MKYIILAGPSSIGKTTYAKKYYKNYNIIDSDDIWYKLAKEYNYNKTKINNELFKRMYEVAKENKYSVLVHTDPSELLKYFKRKEVKIILLGTNFKKLSRNLISRKNRDTSIVLGNSHTGYLFYFEKSEKKPNTLYLKKKDLDDIPIKKKADKKAVDNIISKLFEDNRKTTYITPKSNIDYDSFMVV